MNMVLPREKLSQPRNPGIRKTVSGTVCRRFESFRLALLLLRRNVFEYITHVKSPNLQFRYH